MARRRSPQSVEAEKLYKDGMLLVEIAGKLGVPAGTVRRWKSDQRWDGAKGTVDAKKKPSVRNEKPSVRKSPGGQPGNCNAVGHGGTGPPGNQNALKHGGYAKIFWDTLAEDEVEMAETIEADGEQLLLDEIKLLTVRERRIMRRIAEAEKKKQMVSGVSRFEDKRDFADDEEREQYEKSQRAKVENGDSLPGHPYRLSTNTEGSYSIIQRLEEALTRCQAQKQRCITELNRLRERREGDSKSAVANDWIRAVMEAGQNE